ncbi:MAG: CHAD domain-containing protein [bacterium]
MEFVFLATASQLEQLPRVLPRLADAFRVRPLHRVHDQYLDTPTRLLMRSGVSCRLRRIGKHDTLTLKSLTPLKEGLADRFELSEKLAQEDWNWPGPLPGRVVRTRLIPLTRRLNVQCLFELVQERRVYDIWTREGAHLEVSAGRVCLAGAECADSLQRLEVELKDGLPALLIQFVSDLQHKLGLEPADDSEFTFGLRTAGLSLPILSAGPSLRIRPEDPMRKAAARALTLGFRKMLWHVPGTRLGVDPTCLHDMRVSIRRLRTVLMLFRGALPPRTSEKLAHELKWLGRSLGAVRDLDVHLQECRVMRLQRSGTSHHPAAGICRQEMNRRRKLAYDALCRDLRNPRFKVLKITCRDLIRKSNRPVATGSPDVIRAGARQMGGKLGQILTAGREIVPDTPDKALHRLRIHCKHLRYLCEILADVYGKPIAKMARRLAGLQDVLGRHHDAVMAQAMIERVMAEIAAAPDGATMVSALGGCVANWRQEQFIRRAAFADAWKAFDRKKPRRSFLKTLRHYERR